MKKVSIVVKAAVFALATCINSRGMHSDDSEGKGWDRRYSIDEATLAKIPSLLKYDCPYKKWTSCERTCEHAMIVRSHGHCACICRKNYALKDGRSCIPVLWSEWSSWSDCLKTDWGGLQTRERECRSEESDEPGSCIGKGTESRTCSPVLKEFRIRKRLSSLTDEDIHDLIQAMTKFKKDKSNMGYRHLVLWHGWPGRCPNNRYFKTKHGNFCSWHQHPLFLPWHRIYVAQLELSLSRYLKNKTLGFPYWDWAERADNLPEIIRNPLIYDPVLKKRVKNPFYRSYIGKINGIHRHTQRHPWWPGFLLNGHQLRGTIRALLSRSYHNFDSNFETNPHGHIHNLACIGKGKWSSEKNCKWAMPSTAYSSFDPMFFFIHSGVDRVLTMRRKLEEEYNMADWTRSRVIDAWSRESEMRGPGIVDAFERELAPFCNESINGLDFTGLPNVWRMKNLYYGEQLFGYKYEDYNLADYSWEELKDDFRRNNVDGEFWNDEFLETGIGNLTEENSYQLHHQSSCSQFMTLRMEK